MDLLEQLNGSNLLLNTKLATPPQRGPLLERPDLLARLQSGLNQKLTLISAGAGFGKSTLALQWVRSFVEQDREGSAAWVSLDPGDNDPHRFWRYIFTAVESIDPESGARALEWLEASQSPPFEAALTALINALAGCPGRILLILEDYHLIHNADIHAGMAFLIEHLPPGLHPVFLVRSDPPLPLARLRARSEINDLRAPDLRFSMQEGIDFLEMNVPHPLQPGAAGRLVTRTEGWPAGLRLAALALQGRPDPQDQTRFLDTFTGGHGPLLEYLVEEVLASQPEGIQNFLLQTCFLTRLNGSLCQAVTGLESGEETLEALERANLFLEPLDGAGEWYRYHALFAEAMQHTARRRLGEQRLEQIARSASRWYEVHALRNEAPLYDAVEAALFAREFERAAGLIERSLKPHLVGNEYHTLLRWLEALPESALAAHPALVLIYAQALLFTSEPEAPDLAKRIRALLELGEARWKAEGDLTAQGESRSLQALLAARQGDYARAFELARRALEYLPPVNPSAAAQNLSQVEWRAVSLNLSGWGEFFAGRLGEARRDLAEASRLFQHTRNSYGLLDAYSALGEVHSGRAEAGQAAEYYRMVLFESESAPIERKDRLRRVGRARLGLARLAYDRDDLERARREVELTLEIARELRQQELLVGALILAGRIRAAGGSLEAELPRLESFQAQVRRPDLLRELGAAKAWLALSSGDLQAALVWAGSLDEAGAPMLASLREREALVHARVLLARDEAEKALAVLERRLEDARAQDRARSEMEILILKAEALAALGRLPEALADLTRALSLAAPQGYRRVFLDEGENLAPLLRRAAAGQDAAAAAWARSLLASTGPARSQKRNPVPGPRSHGPGAGLDGALSEQEERVLLLLASGLSNPEIGQELYISVNTVKTHVKSIYRKLNVGSRRAARDAVRRLALIETGQP